MKSDDSSLVGKGNFSRSCNRFQRALTNGEVYLEHSRLSATCETPRERVAVETTTELSLRPPLLDVAPTRDRLDSAGAMTDTDALGVELVRCCLEPRAQITVIRDMLDRGANLNATYVRTRLIENIRSKIRAQLNRLCSLVTTISHSCCSRDQ